jgi:hypothetical protein
MKTKGVSIFEKHAEKAVLALFTLLFLAVFVLQFDLFGDPNAVSIGSRRVSPENAAREVQADALRVKGEMESEPTVEIPDPPGPLARAERMLREPAIADPGATLALMPGDEAASIDLPTTGGGTTPLGEQRYVEVEPPAPADPCAHVYAGAVDPFRVDPALRPMLPDDQPLDTRFVSVQAGFDLGELRAQLAAVPDDPAISPLPGAWYLGRVELLDVRLTRQRVSETGEPIGTEELLPASGDASSIRDQLARTDLLPRDLVGLLALERSDRSSLRNPDPPPLFVGDTWVSPCDALARELTPEDQREIDRLLRQRAQLGREIDRLTGGEDDDADRRRDGDDRPPPRPGGPPTPGGDPDAPDGGDEPVDRDAARLADYRDRIDEIDRSLAESFRVDSAGAPLPMEASMGLPPGAGASATDREAPPTITLWAHDPTPEPGARYRYRMSVQITNPMFGFLDQVADGQRELAARPTIASAASAWTEPVLILPDEMYFVDGAAAGGVIQGAGIRRRVSATIRVCEFFYGFWRTARAELEPGDRLRATLRLPELSRFADPDATPEPLDPEREVVLDAYLVDVTESFAARRGAPQVEVFMAYADGRLEVRTPVSESDPLVYRVERSEARGAEAEIARPGGEGSSRRRPDRGRDRDRDGRPDDGTRPPR